MGTEYGIDITRVVKSLNDFVSYVRFKNKNEFNIIENEISFGDKQGILGQEEFFKTKVALAASEELKFKNWEESWIGSGRIAKQAAFAMNKAANLVNGYQQIKFKDKLSNDRVASEKALYAIYKGEDEQGAFAEATKVFGAKYDLIAYLFFIKDDTRFLPISPENFEQSFCELGIDYKLSHQCNWDNYMGYLSIIRHIQNIMQERLPLKPGAEVRFIDAHSFVWIIHEKSYIDWLRGERDQLYDEYETENWIQQYIEGDQKRKKIYTSVYARNQEVISIAKKRAKGVCQLCQRPAPFSDNQGEPYLEAHHVDWLSRGGKDSTENVVALCPNCHRKMHVVDSEDDVKTLKDILAAYKD